MEQDVFERLQGSKLFRFFDVLSKLVLVNLCIVLLSLCGLVVFGIFPAVFAAAAYFNDVMETAIEGKMMSRMFGYFKKYFWIGNLQMLITVPAVVLVFYVMFGQELSTFLYLLLFCFILVAMVLRWYLPAVNVLYPDFKTGKKVVFSLVAACNRYLLTLLFLVLDIAWLYVVLLIPQLMLFVVFSVPVWFGVWRIKKSLCPDTFFDPDKLDEEQDETEPSH